MHTLPVFLDIQGRHCLLVGTGELAQRKQRLLQRAGAQVVATGDIFSENALANIALVVAASSDDALNEQVSRAAQVHRIPVNVVDRPDLCTFIFPAIVERGPVIIAVSSGGALPVLTRLLRARIETLLPASLGRFAELAGSFRQQVRARLPSMQQRMRFWDQLLQRELVGGDLDALVDPATFAQQLEQFVTGGSAGRLSVVGAGPGNPDLLTFRALRCIQACDLLLFDSGVDPAIINLARRDATHIALDHHADVAVHLQREVEAGKYVVLLKAGDPLSYRDMPLLLAQLQAAGIDCDVVPGIIDQSGAHFHGL